MSNSATEQYPPLPTEATHKVSVNSRLAMRDAPAYLASSDSAAKDNHIKGAIVEMLSNNTSLIVLDEGVGHECGWAQVLVVGKQYTQKKLFVSNKFIKKNSGQKASAPIECGEKSVGKPSAIPVVNWTTKGHGEVALDEQSATYKVTVEMSEQGYVATGGSEISNRLREAAFIGLQFILRHTGKRHDDEYVGSLIDAEYFQFARAEKYFIDTKPGTYLKVLVTLPHRYVPPLEDAPGISSTEGGRSLVAWDAMERVRMRATYKTDEFYDSIESAAKLLEEYAADIDNYDGTIIDYDARTEAERLRLIPGQLTKLFKDNEISHDPFNKSETLEIGWDEYLTPVFVGLSTTTGASIAMGLGMEEFADASPIDSQRTQGYLWQLNLISTQKKSSHPWTEFVISFTLPEAPSIIPGAKGEESAGDISDLESVAKRAAAELDGLPIKTYLEKRAEDRKLASIDFKSKLYLDRKDAVDFVGSSVASCEGLQKTLDKIHTIDDAFGEVLDKISIADLIKQCMDAISPDLGGLGGIGVGDIPSVDLDYDWSLPNAPSLNTDMNLPDVGSLSVSSLNLGSVNFSELGLSDISFDSLEIGSLGLGDLGLGDMSIGSLNLSGMNFGDLGLGSISFDGLGLGSISFGDIDFGTLSVGDLGIDISSFSIGDLGFSGVEIGDFGLSIGDLGFSEIDIRGLGIEVTSPSMPSLTFGQLGLDDMSLGSLGDLGIDLSAFSMGELNLPALGNLADFPDIDLSSLSLGSLPDISISELGLGDFSFDDLNLSGLSIGSFGLDGISLGDLGLDNLNMSALGLGNYDLDGLKEKFSELGLAGVVDAIDDFTLDFLADPAAAIMDTLGGAVDTSLVTDLVDTQFSEELAQAQAKLEEMTGLGSMSENPFEQGLPPKVKSLAIVLPDNLPTEDIMASMGDAIESALTTFLNELFVAMVKQVLEQMIDSCGQDPEQAGKENLNDMLGDSPNNTNQADPLASLMTALGVGLTGAGLLAAKRNPNSEAARAAITPDLRAKMNDMLDDISLIFTPMELCSLINGKANKKVLLLARNFIVKQYPEMNLSSRTKVADFFKAFGRLIDPSICRLIEEPATASQTPILGDLLCTTDGIDDLRREMLRNKGDGITEDQIEDQLKNARQRKVDAAKLLADMVNKGPLSDDFEPPPVVCQKGGNKKSRASANPGCAEGSALPINSPADKQASATPGADTRPGLVELSHESIDFAMDKCIDNLFTPLEVAFAEDMRTYPKTFTNDTDDSESEEIEVWIDKTAEIYNPVVLQKYGTKEVAAKALGERGVVIQNDDGVDVTTVKTKIRKTMPSLYQALRGMETNDTLEFKTFEPESILFEPVEDREGIDDGFSYEYGGYGVKLKLPNPAEGDIASIESEVSGLGDSEAKEEIQKVLAALAAAAPEWNMYYVLPNITETNLKTTHTNDFLLIVTETRLVVGSEERAEQVIYRRASNIEVSEDIADYLDSLFEAPSLTSGTSVAKFDTGLPIVDITDQSLLAASRTAETFSILFDPQAIPDPQYKFASLVQNKWSDAGVASAEAIFEEVISRDGIYSELSKDILAYVSQRIANSAYFNNISPTNSSSSKTKITSSTPVVEFLELDPEPTAEQMLEGVEPNLLGMKQKKKCLKEAVKKECLVDLDKPTDGKPADDLSGPEKEMMKMCVESVFRTYMIDHYLRSLFTNSVFKMSDEPDEAYMNHIISFVLQDLLSYDTPNYVTHEGQRKQVGKWGTYQEDFTTECVRLYEPEEGSEPDSEIDADIEGEYTTTLAFYQQIKKQYPVVKAQMEALVAGRNVTEIEKQFITNYLPTIKIPDMGLLKSKFFDEAEIEGKDWSETLRGITEIDKMGDTSLVQSQAALEAAVALTVADEDGWNESGVTFLNTGAGATADEQSEGMANLDFSNGNLYIEKYYEVEDWSTTPSWWTDDFVGDFYSSSKRGQSLTEDTDPEYYKYFGVMTEEDWKEMENNLPSGVHSHSNTPIVTGLLSVTGVTTATTATKYMFKSVKEGIRIMYLPPVTHSFAVTLFDSRGSSHALSIYTPSNKELFDEAWEASRNSVKAGNVWGEAANSELGNRITREVAIKTKAYKVIEIIDTLSNISVGTASTDDTAATASKAASAYFFKESNPFPVVDVKTTVEPVIVGDAATGTGGSLSLATPSLSVVSAVSAASASSLEDKLLASTEFKALTEFFFPISRYKSVMGLYCFQATSGKREIMSAMATTKDKLRTVFFAINNKGGYQQNDPALESVGGEAGLSKMMQNEFGVKDMPASDSSWNYNMPVSWGRPVKGLGFETVAKATGEALQKMFKQWAEKNDPNISMAHKLAIVTKMANVNIPTLAWSFMVLPANVFPPPIGIGPILSPISIIYHALGLGMWKRVAGAKDGTEDENGVSSIESQLGAMGAGGGTVSPPTDCDDNWSPIKFTLNTELLQNFTFQVPSQPLVPTALWQPISELSDDE